MAGQQVFEIRKTHSARGPDRRSGDYIFAICVFFAVAVVIAKRPGNVTADRKSLMQGGHYDL